MPDPTSPPLPQPDPAVVADLWAENLAVGQRLASAVAADALARERAALAAERAELVRQRQALAAEQVALLDRTVIELRGHAQRAVAANGHLGCELGRFLRADRHSPLCLAVAECARLWRLQADLIELGIGAEPQLYDKVGEVVDRTAALKSAYDAALSAGPRAVRRWARSS